MTLEHMERTVEAALNEVVDPCSVGAGLPMGLVDLGVVDRIEVDDRSIRVTLVPTFPGCRFAPIFQAEARKRLEAIGWPGEIVVETDFAGSALWDESRMSSEARIRLRSHRKRARRVRRPAEVRPRPSSGVVEEAR